MAGQTWAERMNGDTGLRDFLDAELAKAGIDVAAARANEERERQRANTLQDKLDSMRSSDDRYRESNRQKQVRHRRRHSFTSLASESDGR